MEVGKYRPLLSLMLLAGVVFIAHMAICYFAKAPLEILLLPKMYACFVGFSVVLISILIRVKQKNNDNVGYAFLAITTVKMAGAFALLKILLEPEPSRMERLNFFVVFAVFLFIETVITIRLVNKEN